ncbi:hypothetical protein AQ505_16545 [Pedobacter sp. PACM 27299]|uniref:RNA polymerase sigma factor n=1 Tax=Pedobacter sp. PACM 27299 TaxID=1727164 RepID=UPI00070587E6|nr:RNA polymerase sigma-70 factor [Pedobacter sp. PACM 27299]ALL06955.1 hypothetical protein AQ505_16545 [Pedobacter sp. PACM 27299]
MFQSEPYVLEEQVLLSRISLGDERAFAVIYHRYRKRIYAYALTILKAEDGAEDIVHEVFINIWKHHHLEDIENLEAYLQVAARNTILKRLRRQKLERKVSDEKAIEWEESCNATEQGILCNDTRKLLEQGVRNLPPQQKAVFQFCREEGMKYEEVAERMSISRLTVKTHMQHALRFLRAYLLRHTDVMMWAILLQLLMPG